MIKKIIHIDMDCFYAQVEMRDNPSLKNRPVAVGGLPRTRSVLCTSNYEARKYGVKSAMPTDYALKLCPQLKVIEPNFHKYQEASEHIHSILERFSDKIEPLSLDEAYLDVSEFARASSVAYEIKQTIKKETSLTASVGLAPNKFLSKVASDWKKPDGFFVIQPQDIESFLEHLSVKFIPGVGKRNEEILRELGISNCNQLKNLSIKLLTYHFGKFGLDLLNFASGIDHREVVVNQERKSLSTEETFLNDLKNVEEIEREFEKIFIHFEDQIKNAENKLQASVIKKIFVKVKFNDFSKASNELSLKKFISCHEFDSTQLPLYKYLLSQAILKKELPIRLLGLGVRFLEHNHVQSHQLELPFQRLR